MALTEKLVRLQKTFSRFAAREIAPRRDAYAGGDFPLDIWRKMAGEKLLGLAVPRAYGGGCGDYLSIVAAGESLVEKGHDLGLALSWMMHQVMSRFFILGFGNEEQRSAYLPELARGSITACLAISEPKTGAHPRHLQTSAAFQNGRVVLQGEKSFLTNGPLADLFVVIAVSGSTGGKKEFTAFLVPKAAEGLSLTDPLRLNILRSSPHCGIRLENCAVPETSVLGERGSAYRTMAVPFREIEDVLLMGPAIGGMKSQLDMVIAALKEGAVKPAEDLLAELGGLESLIHALRIIAREAAKTLDREKTGPQHLPLILSLRPLAREFQARLRPLADAAGLCGNDLFEELTRDIAGVVNIARHVALIKQRKIGEALLSGKD